LGLTKKMRNDELIALIDTADEVWTTHSFVSLILGF
jgi:hypothetical protein